MMSDMLSGAHSANLPSNGRGCRTCWRGTAAARCPLLLCRTADASVCAIKRIHVYRRQAQYCDIRERFHVRRTGDALSCLTTAYTVLLPWRASHRWSGAEACVEGCA